MLKKLPKQKLTRFRSHRSSIKVITTLNHTVKQLGLLVRKTCNYVIM